MSTSDLLRSAADWYACLRSERSGPQERAAFEAWLDADPARRLAYAEVAAAALAFDQIEPGSDVEVPPRGWVAAAPARRSAWRIWAAMAAALVIGLGVLQGERWSANLRADWSTEPGEVRSAALPDGSQLWVGADSAVRFRAGPDARVLELLRGDVFVAVEPDATKPFRIESSGVSVRAVGTRFAVARLDRLTEIGVEEGVVEVETEGVPPRRVHAGEGARATAGQARIDVAVLDTAASWREGLLVFDALPLSAAVARIERYLPQRVLLFAGDRAETPVTALIPADQAERGLEAMLRQQGLRVRRLPGLLVISD